MIRWDRCIFPGCHRKAANADIDHVTPWSEGGETNIENCVPLCARHHHLKHEATGWQLKPLPDTVEWTDPHGRTYLVEPHTYPLDTTTRSTVISNDNPDQPDTGGEERVDAGRGPTEAPPFYRRSRFDLTVRSP